MRGFWTAGSMVHTFWELFQAVPESVIDRERERETGKLSHLAVYYQLLFATPG